MKSKNIIPVILVITSIILFIVALILFLNTNYINNGNKNDEKENGVNKQEEVEINKQEIQNDKETEVNDGKNNTVNKDEKEINDKVNTKDEVSNDKNETSNKKDNKVENKPVKYTEEDVISYFSNREKEIKNNQEDKTLREKVKETFVSIVDFIFYDKEIKGYTFDELTTKTKLKIIEIALSIDNKIDKYFPDYKETIKDKYIDIKGKLAVKYLEFTEKLCDSVGSDVCSQAKEDFNTMKESFGFTWELIKELAKSGSDKVKEFYESWKDA